MSRASQVWILIAVMCLCYGLFIYAVERKPEEDADFPSSGYAAFRETFWHALMVTFETRDKPVHSPAGKIATVTYSFVVLIMLSAYTANLAATMSSERIPEVVKGVDQLKSKVASVFVRLDTSSGHFTEGRKWRRCSTSALMCSSCGTFMQVVSLEWRNLSSCVSV